MKDRKAMLLILAIIFLFNIVGMTSCRDGVTSSKSDSSISEETGNTNKSDGSNVGEETSAANDESSTSSNENDSTTVSNSKPTKNNTTTTGPKIGGNVDIGDSKKSIEDGLNFGGKTFTLALETSGNNPEATRIVAAFNKKFNINLKIEALTSYTNQVAAKLASGTPYDVCFMGTYRFPTDIFANLYEPIQDIVYEADLYDSKNPSKGGLDLQRSKNFAWEGKLYGVTGVMRENDASPIVLFYNKKMISEAGGSDPRKLYDQGKWTWDAFKQIGKAVTDIDSKVYMSNTKLYRRYFVGTNAATYVKWDKGVPSEDLTNKKLSSAFKLLQSMTTGANLIVNAFDYTWDAGPFINGKIAMWAGAVYEYYNNNELAKRVLSANAFGKNLKNLGMVPYPVGPDNTDNVYPHDDIRVWCAGKGTSDRRVAVAFAKFRSYYIDPVKPQYSLNASDQELVKSLFTREALIHNYRGFASSSTTIAGVIENIERDIAQGKDISQTLNNYRSTITSCIKATLDKKI